MINKFQVGGKTPQDQQAQIQQAIMQISQATGEQPETIIAAIKNGKDQFQKVLQAIQQGDVQTAKAMIQQLAGTKVARLGTKLNYIRSLKGACPEGQEIKYFAKGGKCKCIDKAAGGERVRDGKKEIADFKKACKGRKFEDGGKSKKPKYTKDQIAGRTPVKVVNGVKYFLNGDGQVVKDPKGKGSIYPTDTVHIKNPVTKKMEVRDVTNDHKHKQFKPLTKKEYQSQSKDKKADIDLKGYCKGGKAKKHQLGGPLKKNIWNYQEPQIMNQGQKNVSEVTSFTSRPDEFGRTVDISRHVMPKRDGSLGNDTMYQARIQTPYRIYGVNGDSQVQDNPKKVMNRPFNTWGDYFKYLLSLRKKKFEQGGSLNGIPFIRMGGV